MRKVLAILICKLAKAIGKRFGHGSSLPGKIALKICPDVLSRIQMPECVIAVTGSNGKTSTVEMIRSILERSGKSVACNTEGSNQIEGAATLILCNSTNAGVFRKDILLLEVDERYAKYIFKYFAPTYYVINNLYRDQMTRNGHPEYVLEDIRKSLREETKLILNADDPLVSSLAVSNGKSAVYFGINDNQYVTEECDSLYDDGYYCPVCHSRMIYDYRHFAHVGSYRCLNCGFRRNEPDFAITSISLEKGKLTINKRCHLDMAFRSIYNAYNVLAAFSVASLAGVKEEVICDALNNYLIRNGRIVRFRLGDKEGTLLISKHENTISYNRNLDYVANYSNAVTLLLIIDDISRKYFTSDTSWLWDISFEILRSDNVKKVIVAGKYISDVAVRLESAGIDMEKVVLRRSIETAVSCLRFKSEGDLFVMTCFSDVAKFLKEVETE
ncbi:MAG: DUF1727 domain-containing protein [Erysipelotrichaceae bacterium]|nr:DUF1727 domain-containing protein [Erysipelotrichaceae bacterium]